MHNHEPSETPLPLNSKEQLVTGTLCYCFISFAYLVLAQHLGWVQFSFVSAFQLIAISAIQASLIFALYRWVTMQQYHGAYQLALLLTVALFLSLLSDALFTQVLTERRGIDIWPPHLLFSWMLLSLTVAYIYALGKQRHLDRRMRALTTQAHMRILAEQLSPHFVFNALNSLRFMLAIDPRRAATMAHDIRDIISDLDSFSRRDMVPLDQDLTLLEKYLRLVKVQLGSHFSLHIRHHNNCKRQLVLPLILQLLAENCVKHCLNKLVRGELMIQVRQYREQLIYRIYSTNPSNSEDAHTDTPDSQLRALGLNVGIHNIQSRLKLSYQEHYRYRFQTRKCYVSTLIIMPCRFAQADGDRA